MASFEALNASTMATPGQISASSVKRRPLPAQSQATSAQVSANPVEEHESLLSPQRDGNENPLFFQESRPISLEDPRQSQVATTSAELIENASDHDDELKKGNVRRTGTSKSFWGLFDWWWWEIFGILTSVGFLGAIVGILHRYDDKGQPNWSHGIKLNGLIAFFATVGKAALLLPVTAAISQLKWQWYRRSRKARNLGDIEIFDRASRGPWGALLLFFRLRGLSFAFFGAAIVVTSLLFEFFTQQAVTTRVRNPYSPSDSVRVGRSKSFNDGNLILSAAQTITFPLNHALVSGFFTSTGSPNLAPNCHSGNCTWPEFDSLAFCSQCIDITDDTRGTEKCSTDKSGEVVTCSYVIGPLNTTISYDNSLSKVTTGGVLVNLYPSLITFPLNGYINEGGALKSPGSAAYAGFNNPLFAFSALNYNTPSGDETSSNFTFDLKNATECAISLCVKTYNITVLNGQSSQNVTSTWYNTTQVPNYSGLDDYVLQPFANSSVVSDGPYIFNAMTAYYLGMALNTKFSGNVTLDGNPDDSYSQYSLEPTSDMMYEMYSSGNLSQVVENVALSLTDYIQKDSATNTFITGQQSTVEVYVHVRWLWLLLPIILVALGLVFLVMTIIGVTRHDTVIWKSSSLALLFHGLDEPLPEERFPLDHLGEMERVADTMPVVMQRKDEFRGAWRFFVREREENGGGGVNGLRWRRWKTGSGPKQQTEQIELPHAR